MLVTLETQNVVADLLLIFLSPHRHGATCEQQLDGVKDGLATWTDEPDDQSISLVPTDEL